MCSGLGPAVGGGRTGGWAAGPYMAAAGGPRGGAVGAQGWACPHDTKLSLSTKKLHRKCMFISLDKCHLRYSTHAYEILTDAL